MRFTRTAASTVVLAALAAGCVAVAQDQADPEVERQLRSGASKSVVEGPVKHALEDSAAAPTHRARSPEEAERVLRMGVSKGGIELPIKDALRAPGRAASPKDLAALRDRLQKGPAAGSRPADWVQPGRVCWHASYADALAAARRSGKPVLLFQLLGRLDETFC